MDIVWSHNVCIKPSKTRGNTSMHAGYGTQVNPLYIACMEGLEGVYTAYV